MILRDTACIAKEYRNLIMKLVTQPPSEKAPLGFLIICYISITGVNQVLQSVTSVIVLRELSYMIATDNIWRMQPIVLSLPQVKQPY